METGFPFVDELLDRLPASIFRYWQAFFSLRAKYAESQHEKKPQTAEDMMRALKNHA